VRAVAARVRGAPQPQAGRARREIFSGFVSRRTAIRKGPEQEQMRLSSPHGRRFAQVRGAQPEITSHHAKPSPHPPPSPLPTAAPLGKIPAPPSRLERGSAARPTPPAPPGAGGAAAQHSHPGRRRGRCLGSAPRCQQNGVYSPVAFARLSARWARARPGGQERGEAAEGVGRRGDARGGGGHGHALPVRALRGEHECRRPQRASVPSRSRLPCARVRTYASPRGPLPAPLFASTRPPVRPLRRLNCMPLVRPSFLSHFPPGATRRAGGRRRPTSG
jgi:hypothetical protein